MFPRRFDKGAVLLRAIERRYPDYSHDNDFAWGKSHSGYDKLCCFNGYSLVAVFVVQYAFCIWQEYSSGSKGLICPQPPVVHPVWNRTGAERVCSVFLCCRPQLSGVIVPFIVHCTAAYSSNFVWRRVSPAVVLLPTVVELSWYAFCFVSLELYLSWSRSIMIITSRASF